VHVIFWFQWPELSSCFCTSRRHRTFTPKFNITSGWATMANSG